MKKAVRKLILLLAVLVWTVCAVCGAPAEEETAPEPPVIDLDLAGLSGTVVYAQVYNLISDWESYLGKIIRMEGYYSYYQDPDTGMVYHAVVIPDATACCTQGFEFVWAEADRAWPEEYPEAWADITVTGRLEVYEENGYQYLHLVDAELVFDPAREPAQ